MNQCIKNLKKQPHWKDINNIILTLSQHGFETFIVGGAVRDALLKKPIKDIDLASSAKPKQITKIFPKANSKFSKYGVVFIPLKNNHKIEITTFRKDSIYKDGRRPQSVKYSTIEEDVKRRDFTINALFYDTKTDQVIDLVNGVKDLKSKTIRTVGKSEKRFSEDYLRMLRALRLSHQLNFKLDKEIKLALLKLNKNIKNISKERVLEELTKMFLAGKIGSVLKILNNYGLFQYIFPQLALYLQPANCFKQKQLKFWKGDFSFFHDPAFCWTAVGLPFFYSDTKSFTKFLKTYPIKTAVIKQAVSYLKSVQTLTETQSSFTDQLLAFNGQKKQVYELTFNFLESGLLKNKEKLKKNLKFIFTEFNKREIKNQLPPPLIKGSDLLKLSPALQRKNFSKILKQAYSYQIEKPNLTKKEILKKLK